MDNADKFPSQLRHRADAVVSAAFSPISGPGRGGGDGSTLLLRSHGFLCLVDLAALPPKNARLHPPTHMAAVNDLARRQRLLDQRRRHDAYLKRCAARATAESATDAAGVGAKRGRSSSVVSEASLASDSEAVGSPAAKLRGRRERADSAVLNAESGAESDEAAGELDNDGETNKNFAITLK